ncbi:Predicted NTP binding protein (contains STAS domain) [Kingella potus]|uniref:Predicted NTP binding protein (Contains STAS domain) n=1 Tax=Kingella potus TaxID=265175 RepID=A0A377R131_9NEIS|nr:STAS domain-containing protein [Kingella potus]STR02447.1 Predicted NTP binding protein (contains STAS domain) [Kingella potus]
MNCELRDGVLYLSGDITVKTVQPAAYQRFRQLCRQNAAALDLSAVGRADSACLSLLLEALRGNSGIRLRHLPDAVSALAELYEVREWMPL